VSQNLFLRATEKVGEIAAMSGKTLDS